MDKVAEAVMYDEEWEFDRLRELKHEIIEYISEKHPTIENFERFVYHRADLSTKYLTKDINKFKECKSEEYMNKYIIHLEDKSGEKGIKMLSLFMNKSQQEIRELNQWRREIDAFIKKTRVDNFQDVESIDNCSICLEKKNDDDHDEDSDNDDIIECTNASCSAVECVSCIRDWKNKKKKENPEYRDTCLNCNTEENVEWFSLCGICKTKEGTECSFCFREPCNGICIIRKCKECERETYEKERMDPFYFPKYEKKHDEEFHNGTRTKDEQEFIKKNCLKENCLLKDGDTLLLVFSDEEGFWESELSNGKGDILESLNIDRDYDLVKKLSACSSVTGLRGVVFYDEKEFAKKAHIFPSNTYWKWVGEIGGSKKQEKSIVAIEFNLDRFLTQEGDGVLSYLMTYIEVSNSLHKQQEEKEEIC